MKSSKIDLTNKWNYFLVISFIVSNIMIYSIDININRQGNLFWLLYILVFWIFPISSLILISKKIRKFSFIESDKIETLRQELYNSIGTNQYPIKLIKETIVDKGDDRYFLFEGIFNRSLAFYYIGIIGCLVLVISC